MEPGIVSVVCVAIVYGLLIRSSDFIGFGVALLVHQAIVVVLKAVWAI